MHQLSEKGMALFCFVRYLSTHLYISLVYKVRGSVFPLKSLLCFQSGPPFSQKFRTLLLGYDDWMEIPLPSTSPSGALLPCVDATNLEGKVQIISYDITN